MQKTAHIAQVGSPQKRGLGPKAARIKAGLSGERLAAAVPCSASLVWFCEQAGRFPRQRLIRAAYLAALGITEAQACEDLAGVVMAGGLVHACDSIGAKS